MATWSSWQIQTISVVYFCFVANILAYSAFTMGLPLMMNEVSFGMTAISRSDLLSHGMLGFIIAKMMSGYVADRVGPHRMIPVAMALIGLCMLIMSRVQHVSRLVFPLILCRGSNAAMWPCMGKITRQTFGKEGFGAAWGLVSTSSRGGAVLAGLILAPVLAWGGWRSALNTAATSAAVAAALATYYLQDPPTTTTSPMPSPPSSPSSSSLLSPSSPSSSSTPSSPPPRKPKDDMGILAAIPLFIRSPRLWMVLVMETCLLLMLDATTILPSFLTEAVGMDPPKAAQVSTACPTGGALAVVVVGYLHNRMGARARAMTFISLLVISLGALWQLSQISGPTDQSRITMLLLIFGAGVSPVKYMVCPNFCSAFGGDHYMGTLFSALDVPGFTATWLFYRHWPTLGGWPAVFRLFYLANLVALVALVMYLVVDLHAPTTVFYKAAYTTTTHSHGGKVTPCHTTKRPPAPSLKTNASIA